MKICISRLNKMGDMILTLPIIKSLKNEYPQSKIHVLTSHTNAKVIKNVKYIDSSAIIKRNPFLLITELINIRKNDYDYFINFSPNLQGFILCLFSRSFKKATLILKSRYNNNKFSKIFYILMSKIFFNHSLVIDRFYRIKKNKEIHQTSMMFELIEKCKLKYSKNTLIDINLSKEKYIFSKKNSVTIHLSEKWINSYYSENDFIDLIKLIIKKNYFIILTTDNSTRKKFDKIFKKFPLAFEFNANNINSDTIILDRLDYYLWNKVIYSSQKVITPECGCSHVAAANKVPVSIIYDPDNHAEAIHKEYAPWKSEYKKFTFDQKDLNLELIRDF